MLDTKLFKKRARLEARKKELAALAKQVDKEIADTDRILIDSLIEHGMDKLHIEGKCLHLSTLTVATISNKKEAIRILKNSGFEDFVNENYHAGAISKLVRDLIEENGSLPESFGDVIKPYEKTKLLVKNG